MILTAKKGLDALLAAYGSSARALPAIAGCYHGGSLAVCGDAACVWDDLERLGCRDDEGRGRVARRDWHFMTVNKLVETFPGDIEHCYSNSGHFLATWVKARRHEYQHEFDGPRHTHACLDGATWRWPWPGQGTSGWGAVVAGVGLGYARVALCGIPLDDGPHNGEPPWRGTKFCTEVRAAPDGGAEFHWRRVAEMLGGTVRSMSGRTRDWLGDAAAWA